MILNLEHMILNVGEVLAGSMGPSALCSFTHIMCSQLRDAVGRAFLNSWESKRTFFRIIFTTKL